MLLVGSVGKTNTSRASDIFIYFLMEQFLNNSLEMAHYNESNSDTELNFYQQTSGWWFTNGKNLGRKGWCRVAFVPVPALAWTPALLDHGLGAHEKHCIGQSATDERAFMGPSFQWRCSSTALGKKKKRFVKTGEGDCYFKCKDSNAELQETWKIKETWHHPRITIIF